MKTIYNNHNFQKAHAFDEKIITSEIKGLEHNSKIIKSNIKGLYYCETVWGYSFPTNNSNLEISYLWKKWNQHCQGKNIIAEIIKIPPFITFEALDTTIFDELHIVSRTCALQLNEDDFFSQISQKTRNIIRNSDKKLFCRKAEMSDSLEIYNLYSKSMSNFNAEKKYFLGLKTFDYLCNDKNSIIYLAFLDEQLIGFVCFLFDQKISHYHLSASNQLGRKYNANYLLLFKAINESINKGIQMVHFGGGLTNLDNDNLFKFKKKFSNHILQYRIGLCIHNKQLFNKFRNKKSNKIIDLKDN